MAEKQLENRDLGITEISIQTSISLKTLNEYKRELELANKILNMKVKGNVWEIKERTFYKINSRLLLAITKRKKELITILPWYKLLRFWA